MTLHALYSLTWASFLLLGPVTQEPQDSYLRTVMRDTDGALQTCVEPYLPQDGDLVLFDEHNKIKQALFLLAGTRTPDHAGMVVSLPDGRLAILEAAPDTGTLAGPYVCLVDLLPRLRTFRGTVYVRRLKVALTPEQSMDLTQFALAQLGKRLAWGRLILQGTPFRCRGPITSQLFGKTDLNSSTWLCSELVVAAGTVVGLFDPNVHRANTMYPRDLLDDKTYDLSQTWLPAGVWSPSPFPIQPPS